MLTETETESIPHKALGLIGLVLVGIVVAFSALGWLIVEPMQPERPSEPSPLEHGLYEAREPATTLTPEAIDTAIDRKVDAEARR